LKILITGAGGFLGKFLTKFLSVRHEIHAATRDELDLKNPDQVEQYFQTRFDAVIHCAAAGRHTARSMDPRILYDNILSWNHLLNHRQRYGMLINIASGAEFDVDRNINQVKESDLWHRSPAQSYGLSKNIIAKSCQSLDGFFNLRLFGCFDPSESDLRPIKKCGQLLKAQIPFTIAGDRPFDMVSANDFAAVVSAVLDGKIHDKDINVVYNKKHTLSQILKIYSRLHGLDPDLVQIESIDSKHYTGDSGLLDWYQLPLMGLDQSLKEYL
jgi:UDP-glucose 4-epimerase